MYQGRDSGIGFIKARLGRSCYGMGLGIIILDDVYPGFPGDVRNASAFPFPIQYEIARGVDIFKLVVEDDKSPCLAPVRQAALNLERMGCRAIAAECGYFAYFQREIAASVRLPVFMSSLLQVPMAQQLVGPERVVGILMANAHYLTPQHLEAVGIAPGSNYVVGDAMSAGTCREFDHLWTQGRRSDPPAADYARAEAEFLEVATDFARRHPNMGALVLECTGFSPFARALQREVDLPILSWGTLLDYAYAVAVHRDYYGHV
ncbi:MAG TPA: aspartate/glutamate racemase family protein [Anaerolineae bacterium]|nr:aspartate/glutamate racemase family protein [Anaerolineae bacterium]HOQ99902.1 aspartate/glutamate racemase family protein [Anaerolineae bacterium]HPL29413.1 aspartate/glutamate racemase family protein [Anaerolineae bacterium]